MGNKIVQSLISGIALKKPLPISMTPEQEEAVKAFTKKLFQLEDNKLKENLPFIDDVISSTRHKKVLVIINLDDLDEYENHELLDENYYKALQLKWILEQQGCEFEEFHVRFAAKSHRHNTDTIFPEHSMISEYIGDYRKLFLSDLVITLDVKEAVIILLRSISLPIGVALNYGKLINAYEAA